MSQPDPKRVVASGYDQVAERYLQWSGSLHGDIRARYLDILRDETPVGSKVLDLGCGSGDLASKLIASDYDVTGVDISQRQIELARDAVPNATFMCSDMTILDFADSSFDAVIAFYSIIHVPRAEQTGLISSISRWLRPGSLFIASMSTSGGEADYDDDWLGAEMFWSGFDSDANKAMTSNAGLDIVTADIETMHEFSRPVSFLWIVAKKPETAS